MGVKRTKKLLIKGIIQVLSRFDLFGEVKSKEVNFVEYEVSVKGVVVVKGVPFNFQVEGNAEDPQSFELGIDYRKFYTEHEGDTTPAVQEMKKELITLSNWRLRGNFV